jgi:uncharacterized protein (DUF2147 family)
MVFTKYTKFKLIIALFLISNFTYSQTILGKWKTIDDVTGTEKGVVEIYEISGVYYAKIVEIFEPQHRFKKCSRCCCDEKDKPLMGLVIVKGLKKDDDKYDGGEVLDPKNGKYYSCYISLIEKDKLKIRGFIGVPLLGRTQYWYRVKK